MVHDEIIKRIHENIEDTENYLYLADHYLEKNPDLAYLSMENAAFFETDEERKRGILMMMAELKNAGVISVRPSSFVILSFHNLDFTRNCLQSIRMTCCPGSFEIIVVDNGSEDEVISYLKSQRDIKLILNDKNVGFPKGCNQGIDAAEKGNDIFLLNNDTVMMPNALYCMRMALYGDDIVGAVGAMGSDPYTANDQGIKGLRSITDCIDMAKSINVPDPLQYERKIWLVGFALLIRHDAFEKIGMLDERFTPGNYEDNDYGLRIIEAGFKNILCHNCLIFHYGGGGFKHEKKQDEYTELCITNSRKLNEKWQFNAAFYGNVNEKIISAIENEHPDHADIFSVLEIGCGVGATLLRMKYLYPNVKVYGIEPDMIMAALCEKNLDIHQGSIEGVDISKKGAPYDHIFVDDQIADIDEVRINELGILKKGGQLLMI